VTAILPSLRADPLDLRFEDLSAECLRPLSTIAGVFRSRAA
jgi:hypothetical protein